MFFPTQAVSLATTGLLGLGAMFGGSSLGEGPGVADVVSGVQQESAIAVGLSADITAMLNVHRISNGVAPVEQSPRLDAEAQRWANHLAATGQFKHDDMYCENGLCMSENIAITHHEAPLNAFDQWVDSPGHNANMLGSNAVEVGHGAATMQHGPYTGQPVVVQKFFNQ